MPPEAYARALAQESVKLIPDSKSPLLLQTGAVSRADSFYYLVRRPDEKPLTQTPF